MNIGTVKISFPIKVYESKVTVITPRKPTVFEHQILQAIKSLSKTSDWNNKGIYELFEKLFMVPSPNSFIAPVLIELRRMNVINFEEPDISNNDIAVGNITITKDGHEMMKKGELPSAEREEISTDKFDLITNNVLLNNASVKQSSENYRIKHDEFEKFYPKEIISDTLMSRSVDWLKKGISKIRNVEESSSELSWISEECNIYMSDNGVIGLNCPNKEYEQFLEGHKIKSQIINDKFKQVSHHSMGENSIDVHAINNTAFNFKSIVGGMQFITQQRGDVGIFDSNILDRGDYNVSVVCNSNIDKVQNDQNKLIIYTNKAMPIASGCRFIDHKNNLFINNINVSINGESDSFPIAYSVKSLDKTIDEILKKLQIYYLKIVPGKASLFLQDNGNIIKKMMKNYECRIDLNEEGRCLITQLSNKHSHDLLEYISFEPKVGDTYEGIITKVDGYGAYIEISPVFSGFIPKNELSWDEIEINSFIKEDDRKKVQLMRVKKNKYRFSIKKLVPPPKKRDKKSSENSLKDLTENKNKNE